MHTSETTLVDVLRERAATTPRRVAFEFLVSHDDSQVIDYAKLDLRARALAVALRERGVCGQRVLLLYPPGIDYIAGFLGCLYAGAVAVPVYPPAGGRGTAAVLTVAADAGAALALGDRTNLAAMDSVLETESLMMLATDEVPDSAASDWYDPGLQPGDLAFLQYTSGSTGMPKGVMVRHANLMHNLALIKRAIGAGAESRSVSWLPPYHDMGLIGGILEPVYSGFPSTLITPMAFLRRPLVWLEAMSRRHATLSVAPDFGYLECVRRTSPEERAGLDLSYWRRALVGSEPVRASTLDAFVDAFAPAGFRRSAFLPCYGLAEATLFVTGADAGDDPRVIEVNRGELERGRARPEPGVSLTGYGRSGAGDLVVVVDVRSGRPCGSGEVGEIWVSGDGVTGGYWGKPDETGRAFHARLDGVGDRTFLRTGDLGFQLDGDLFVTGRAKDLIVIRGRNYYPDDIERTAESAHVDLLHSAAAAFSVDDDATERVVLVHEVVRGFREMDAPAVVDAIRQAVVAAHGLALYDVVLVRRGTIPRTTSGKIRRATCRDGWRAGTLSAMVVPEPSISIDSDRTGLEELIGRALGLPAGEVDPDRSLVGCGLDSLGAVRLAAAVRESRGVDIEVGGLLDGMTTRALADAIGELHQVVPSVQTPATPVGPVDATQSQHWMWLLDRQIGESGACHVVGGVRLAGPVNSQLLRSSLDELVRQHAVLRSVFQSAGSDRLQVAVRAPRPAEFLEIDVSGSPDPAEAALRIINDLATRPFQLSTGPLLRAILVRTGVRDWCLGVCAHHIIVDAWSLGLLLSDLGTCYHASISGLPVPSLTRPALETTVSGDDDTSATFWREYLVESGPADLPLDRPMPAAPDWRAASLPFKLSAPRVARLKAFAAAHDATLFMVLLAGLGVVLARAGEQRNLVIGTPSAGRDGGNAERLGLFINVLPLRVDLSGSPSFSELLCRVRSAVLATYPHRDLPLARVLREAPTGGSSLVRAVLALQNVPMQPWQAGQVRAEPFELPAPGAQFEFYLRLTEFPDGRISGYATYPAPLFEMPTVQTLLDAYQSVLDIVVDVPDVPVEDLPLPSGSAQQNRAGESVGPAVLERVARGAALPAFVSERGVLNYGQLDAESNRLAWLMKDFITGADQIVAVYLPNVAELGIAVLGCHKAGAAVALLDPSDEAAAFTRLDELRPAAVVTTRALAGGVRETGAATVCLDARPHIGYPSTNPEVLLFPDALASVIDDGLMIHHAGLADQAAALATAFPLTTNDVVLMHISVAELAWVLSAGAEIALADPGVAVQAMQDFGVTVWVCTTEELQEFLAAGAPAPEKLRGVICTQWLPSQLADRARAELPALTLQCSPVPSMRCRVLDRVGRPVPVGFVGEVHLDGRAVPRGFLGRPAQTAKSFVPDPEIPGGRLYRTGVRGRLRPDGTVLTTAPPRGSDSAAPEAVETKDAVWPRNEVERRLARIWCELLGLPEVSVTRDLFALGGHSLLATRIMVRIRGEFGVEIPVAELRGGGMTIERLASAVRSAQADQVNQADADEIRGLLAELAEISDEQAIEILKKGISDFDSY